MTSKAEVLAILPKLDKVALKEIHAVAGMLLEKSTDDSREEYRELYELVCLVINTSLPWSAFKTLPAYRQWLENAPIAQDFLNQFPKLTPTGKQHIYRYCLGILVDDLRERKIPVKLASIVVNLGRLEKAMNTAFPDYGWWMQNIIIKAMNVR
jgi:hypothetical protein